VRVAALVALFVAGLLAAAALAGAETTTSTTTETTTQVSTTTEVSTEATTPTVERTITRTVPLPAQTTTVSESSVDNTPAWVWIIIAILAAAVIGLVIAYFTRRGDGSIPVAERRRRLDGAIGTWVAQGWAVESHTGDSAVLRRGGELMLLSVDDSGGITSRPLDR